LTPELATNGEPLGGDGGWRDCGESWDGVLHYGFAVVASGEKRNQHQKQETRQAILSCERLYSFVFLHSLNRIVFRDTSIEEATLGLCGSLCLVHTRELENHDNLGVDLDRTALEQRGGIAPLLDGSE
jgi:hypothetical protein